MKGLTDLGVDVFGLIDLTDWIFMDKEELTFANLMDVVYLPIEGPVGKATPPWLGQTEINM